MLISKLPETIKKTPIPVAVFTIPLMVSNNVAALPTRPDTSSAKPFCAIRAVWEVMDRKSRRHVPVTSVATPMIKESDPRMNIHISITNCRSLICNMFINNLLLARGFQQKMCYSSICESCSVLGNTQKDPFLAVMKSLQSFISISGCMFPEICFGKSAFRSLRSDNESNLVK